MNKYYRRLVLLLILTVITIIPLEVQAKGMNASRATHGPFVKTSYDGQYSYVIVPAMSTNGVNIYDTLMNHGVTSERMKLNFKASGNDGKTRNVKSLLNNPTHRAAVEKDKNAYMIQYQRLTQTHANIAEVFTGGWHTTTQMFCMPVLPYIPELKTSVAVGGTADIETYTDICMAYYPPIITSLTVTASGNDVYYATIIHNRDFMEAARRSKNLIRNSLNAQAGRGQLLKMFAEYMKDDKNYETYMNRLFNCRYN